MVGFCQDMSSDYHDVPHCIRNALASSPAPSHFSRISDSSPEPRQEVMIAQALNPVVVGGANNSQAAAAAAGAHDAATSSQGLGQSLLGEAPEIFFRRLREVQDANGVVARQIEEMHGVRYSVPAISGFKEVRNNLEQVAQKWERRTHLLANGVTAATGGVEAVRAGVVQLEQMLSGQAAAATNGLLQLARENEELRAQVTKLNNQMEQLTNDSRVTFASLDKRIADLEGKDLLNEASMDRIRQQLQVLETLGQAAGNGRPNETMVAALNAAREEQDRTTRSVLERIVALERVTKKLRIRDEQIQAELSHAQDGIDSSLNAATEKGKSQRSVRFEDDEPKPNEASQKGAKTEIFTISSPDQANIAGGEGDIEHLGWWADPPPGLSQDAEDQSFWPSLTEPPPLPQEVSKASSSSSSTGQCDWKLLKQFPKVEKPTGQAWERGLQLGQYFTEMVQIAGCVNVRFGEFVKHQIETAQQRYKQRLEEGFVNFDTPEVPSVFAECESRFSMALLSSVDTDIKKGVVEAALGQAVQSFQLLIAVLERFQPGGVEERASLTRFLRNLPTAGSFHEALATMRRLRLAIQRTATP